MPEKNTFYDQLGVTQAASNSEIKRAYRARAKKVHPDLLVDRNSQERKRSEKEIRLLNEAYSVLMKKERRELYDQALKTGQDFTNLEQNTRPESAAEREVREAAEAHYKNAMAACVADIQAQIQTLEGTWRADPDKDDYFDLLMVGNKGPARYKVNAKVLEELGPEDVPGIIEFADAMVSLAPRGLIREQHSYLLIGRMIKDARVLHNRIELYNRRAWTEAPARSARAFIAYMGVREGVVVAPGASGTDPMLPALKLRLMKHFRF